MIYLGKMHTAFIEDILKNVALGVLEAFFNWTGVVDEERPVIFQNSLQFCFCRHWQENIPKLQIEGRGHLKVQLFCQGETGLICKGS